MMWLHAKSRGEHDYFIVTGSLSETRDEAAVASAVPEGDHWRVYAVGVDWLGLPDGWRQGAGLVYTPSKSDARHLLEALANLRHRESLLASETERKHARLAADHASGKLTQADYDRHMRALKRWTDGRAIGYLILAGMLPKPYPPADEDGRCHNTEPGTYGHECGQPATWIGIKNDKPLSTHRMTVHDWEHSYPVAPSARDLVISLGSDAITLLDMPAGDLAAVDYMASEFGYTKPSECVELVRSLRELSDKLTALLAGTGITLESFAESARALDEGEAA